MVLRKNVAEEIGIATMIPFYKPYISGDELKFVAKAIKTRKLSGDGSFTRLCQSYFEKKYSFKQALLTSSGTDALEMATLLLDIQPGDEVIMPSYTFVSTANAFLLRGAKIIFADSSAQSPHLDPRSVTKLITPRTKAIVPVHYAGISCDMDAIMSIANKQSIAVVEDAAQALDSYEKDRVVGTRGHVAAFSFHETKNLIAGECGMIVVNKSELKKRAEIIREKGTNRAAFFRGEIDKYNWMDVGSSYLPSEIVAAFLWGQIKNLNKIQKRRLQIWNLYHELLSPLAKRGFFEVPFVPKEATHNGHLYYIVCQSLTERTRLIAHLKKNGIQAVFHYLSLHKAPYFSSQYTGNELPHSDRYTDCLLRLPLFHELTERQVCRVVKVITQFYGR